MTALAARKAIQSLLDVTPDGSVGPKSRAAFERLALAPADSEWPPASGVHHVQASSFADPDDVARFRRCKAQGHSDKYCFNFGDNGIGTPRLGDGGHETDTTAPIPMCALPPEIWEPLGDAARGKAVIVECAGRAVTCALRDTLPQGSDRIDLNEAAWLALGHSPPQLRAATWRWA